MADLPEQLAAGVTGLPFAGEHQADLAPGIAEPAEDLKRLLDGPGRDDLVVSPVALAQLRLDAIMRSRVIGQQQNRLPESGPRSQTVTAILTAPNLPPEARPATAAFRSRAQPGFPVTDGWGCQDEGMEVLSSRILLRPADLDRSRRFYRDVLGLAIYREFGSPTDPAVVFFLGPGFLEVSGHSAGAAGGPVMIWLQVRDVHAEHDRLAAAGVHILREPATEPWGLTEMWIEDPDGVRIVLVEVPADHPLRRDPRSSSPPS